MTFPLIGLHAWLGELFPKRKDAARPLDEVIGVSSSASLGAIAIFVFYLLHTPGYA